MPSCVVFPSRLHPYLLHFGHFALPMFGVLAAGGLMAALLVSERTAVLAGVDPAEIWDAGLFAVVAAYGLSRLLLLVAFWRSFAAFPLLLFAVPSLTATGVWLTALLTLGWLRWRAVPLLGALDAWAAPAAVAWAALALGHFFEGSDPGVTTVGALGVRMPGAAAAEMPVALAVALFAGLLAGWLFMLLKRRGVPGTVAAQGLLVAGLGQFVATFMREPGLPGPLGLDRIQWVALGLLLAGAMLYGAATTRARENRDAEPEHVAQGPAPPLGTG